MMQYLLKGFVGTFLLSIFLSISTLPAANANEVQKALDTVASKLVTKLPMSKKIALKSLSPDETGLPADFLRKLTSDLESYLLKASNFEAKILNRQVTEDVWGEAIEFGDARFQELYAASEASILVLLSPRITPTGLELSASAYILKGDFSGTLIASSGSISVEADLEKLLGINVNTISDDIDTITDDVDTITEDVDIVKNQLGLEESYVLKYAPPTSYVDDPQRLVDYIYNADFHYQNYEPVKAFIIAEQGFLRYLEPMAQEAIVRDNNLTPAEQIARANTEKSNWWYADKELRHLIKLVNNLGTYMGNGCRPVSGLIKGLPWDRGRYKFLERDEKEVEKINRNRIKAGIEPALSKADQADANELSRIKSEIAKLINQKVYLINMFRSGYLKKHKKPELTKGKPINCNKLMKRLGPAEDIMFKMRANNYKNIEIYNPATQEYTEAGFEGATLQGYGNVNADGKMGELRSEQDGAALAKPQLDEPAIITQSIDGQLVLSDDEQAIKPVIEKQKVVAPTERIATQENASSDFKAPETDPSQEKKKVVKKFKFIDRTGLYGSLGN